MASRSMQLVTYVSLLVELVVSCAQANFLPAKDGDGCFDLLGIQVGNKQYPVPGPGQPNFVVNLTKSCDVSRPCCAVIGVIARDGDFFGDPIPDVWEQTLYYRWEVDGEVPENYFSNYVNCFQYCRGNGLLNKAKYWTYGDHTLTCYVRDPRPGEQGYLYADDWPTVWRGGIGWDRKLDITVRILEPFCSLEFVKPTPGKTLAGNSLVLFKVKTRCTRLKSLSLKLCENVHSVQDAELSEWDPVATEYDENTCITTTTYRAIFNTTDFHNGSHTLKLAAQYTYVKEQENGEDRLVIVEEDRETIASVNVNIENLAITTVEPEGVLAWKGEGNPSIPITVNMVDDDFRDPVNVYVYIYPTNADNRQGWGSPIATRQALGATSSTVQISWDGRIGNTPGEGEYAEPWTYTYDVKVCQEDISEEDFGSEDLNRVYRVCHVEDTYRSEYLTIYRDVDEQGQPIYDAEYYGYDEGDPEDPNDDKYIYLIRRYRLEDYVLMGESKDASEGEVWLYNPDLEKVGTWEISSLQCLNHDNECDGLHAVYEEGHDTRHALLVPVPVSMTEYAGTYIFVLHIKDDHAEHYRDHQFISNGARARGIY
ncbi:MAG: hypothetical protein ACPL7O_00460 [Armatimonadota bacterium]